MYSQIYPKLLLHCQNWAEFCEEEEEESFMKGEKERENRMKLEGFAGRRQIHEIIITRHKRGSSRVEPAAGK